MRGCSGDHELSHQIGDDRGRTRASVVISTIAPPQQGQMSRDRPVLAAIYDGASRTEAAAIGGVTLQIVRDWVIRFNALGPKGLIDRKAPGKPSLLSDSHRAALAAMVDAGPIPAVHGVVRWRVIDLCQWVWDELRGKLGLVWDLLLKADPDGPTIIFRAAYPRGWLGLRAATSSRVLLQHTLGANGVAPAC